MKEAKITSEIAGAKLKEILQELGQHYEEVIVERESHNFKFHIQPQNVTFTIPIEYFEDDYFPLQLKNEVTRHFKK